MDFKNFINLRESTVFQIELFHEQLPLPVPCYDLVPVTELTLSPAYAEISGIPGSLDLTGGFGFLEHYRSPRSERISRTTRVQ